MSRLLIEDEPLVILPALAKAIGLNEAIILQQIHYWLKMNQGKPDHFKEDRVWTYNSYDEWKLQFPWWSIRTIKTIVSSLREKGLILTGEFNRHKGDRTLWYTVDYEKLDSIELIVQKLHNGSAKMSLSNQRLATEIKDKKEKSKSKKVATSNLGPDHYAVIFKRPTTTRQGEDKDLEEVGKGLQELFDKGKATPKDNLDDLRNLEKMNCDLTLEGLRTSHPKNEGSLPLQSKPEPSLSQNPKTSRLTISNPNDNTMTIEDKIQKAYDDCRDEKFINGINWMGFKMPVGKFEGEFITVLDTKYLEGLVFYNRYPQLTVMLEKYLEMIK